MAKPAAKQQVKKIWVPIFAPTLFNNVVIGDSFLATPSAAIGRIVTVSMTVLTNDPQQQHINLGFRITGETKSGLSTELVSYKFSPGASKRFVRRSRSKIEDSFQAIAADGTQLRIKPMLVARSKIKGGTAAAIHKTVRDTLSAAVSKLKLEDVWNSILNKTLQRSLGDSLKKIYPMAACEFRWVFVAGKSAPKEEALPADEVLPAEAKPQAEAQPVAEAALLAEESQAAPEEAQIVTG